jgi:hypothetical protein
MESFMDLLGNAILICKKTESWLSKWQSGSGDSYDTLAPKCNDNENMQEYFRALKFAISNRDVRNIAITGNYGAGKSTVISSFLHYHSSEKYINVSLAGFDMTDTETPVVPKPQDIELSILQQILYKENRDALPDSGIDRILNRGWYHILKNYGTFLLAALPTALFFGTLYFDKVAETLGFPKAWHDYLARHYMIRGATLAILAFIALFFITRMASRIGILDKKIRLGKLAFLSGEIVANNNKEPTSLLNNCLDEIVYFFSRLPYKIVVFEDLDRLENNEIFIKLREINTIINNSKKHKNPVKFIYAVKEDIFLGADSRTKFFDFIIPVVPYMDSRNAYSKLKTKTPSLDKSGDIYLKKMAVYFSNMRSMQNTINEYEVFSKIVDNSNSKDTDTPDKNAASESKSKLRLFSLVFYKNIFSLDYHLADKKTGLLYLFIQNYRNLSLHKEFFESLDEKIDTLRDKAQKLNEEIATYPEHIRKDIISRFIPEKLISNIYITWPHPNNINLHTRFNTKEMISNEDVFLDGFRKHTLQLEIHINNQRGYLPFSTTEKNLILKEYSARMSVIKNDKNEVYRKLHDDIRDTQNEIRAQNATPLHKLITLMGRQKFGELAEQYLKTIKEHKFITEQQKSALETDMNYGGIDALYMLLSEGLIAQDFMSYRSIFHNGSLSADDNEFIKAVGLDLSCENSNRNFYIDDAGKVISELAELNQITYDGALHHRLLEHVMQTDSPYLTQMIASLFRHSDAHIFAVFSLLNNRFSSQDIFEKFVERALKDSDNLEHMLGIMKANADASSSDNIAVAVMACTSPGIKDVSDQFRDYAHFIGCPIIHLIPESKLGTFLSNLDQAGVCYDDLFPPVTDSEFSAIRYIADKNLYQITQENVSIVISALLTERHVTIEKAQKFPWTLIQQNKLNSLITYYTDNIDMFVQQVFIHSEEDRDSIKEILTMDELSDESVFTIIKEMDFQLSDVCGLTSDSVFQEDGIDYSLHDLFYQYNHVTPSWSSLVNYMSEDFSKDVFQSWLTRHATSLQSDNPFTADKTIYTHIICCDEFDKDTYRALLAGIHIESTLIDNNLTVANFSELIELQKIPLEEKAYQHLTSVYPAVDENLLNIWLLWFSQYKDVFMDNTDIYLRKNTNPEFFSTCIVRFMDSRIFTENEKANIVAHFSDYYSDPAVSDINIPQPVVLLVLDNSDDPTLKTKLLADLIRGGYQDKTRMAQFCRQINEPSLASAFENSTQATITAENDDTVRVILDAARARGIISQFDTREDGKIEVTIPRERSASDEEE